MSWKIRHEGSPRAIEGLTLQQVLEGLRDGLWEATDEVMGPDETEWVPIEAHPFLEEAVADMEPAPPKVHDDETRLDMNPLIDVALVLLIFFILTTTYETIRKVLDMPRVSAASEKEKKVRVVTAEQVKEVMIKVVARTENGKTVVRIEDKPIELKELSGTLRQFVKSSRKTQMLIDASGVEWGTVVTILDAAKGAGIEKANLLNQPK